MKQKKKTCNSTDSPSSNMGKRDSESSKETRHPVTAPSDARNPPDRKNSSTKKGNKKANDSTSSATKKRSDENKYSSNGINTSSTVNEKSTTNKKTKRSNESSRDDSMTDSASSSKLTQKDLDTRKALLERSYHLPGNNYSQDLFQYLLNSHPLMGILYYHPLHPVGWRLRVAAFLGSVIFGLAMTNIIYLAFVLDERDFDASYYAVSINHNVTQYAEINENISEINVTNGMIALWTFGGAIHAIYDNLIWSIAACACCLEGGRLEAWSKYRKFGPYIVMFLVVGITAVATLAVLIRATIEADEEVEEEAQMLQLSYTANAESYRFLIAFSVEIVISLMFWSPLVAIIMFTGVLSCCGKIKISALGGRQAAVSKELNDEDSSKDAKSIDEEEQKM